MSGLCGVCMSGLCVWCVCACLCVYGCVCGVCTYLYLFVDVYMYVYTQMRRPETPLPFSTLISEPASLPEPRVG